jgi:hypothetical protein
VNPTQLLLARSVCGCPPEPEQAGFKVLLEKFTDWQGLSGEAERQRMAPLLYFYLRACGAVIPSFVRDQLAALSLRHRLASVARGRVLAELLGACAAGGVKTVLLKGAALAYMVYPKPELRPMRDVDLLVAAEQAPQLHAIAGRLGFHAVPEPEFLASDKHFPALVREEGGITLSLEIHTQLYDSLWRKQPAPTAELLARARPFTLDGQPAWSLALEDMLGHIYQHMVIEEIRWIGVADLLGLAGRYQAQIDWARVRREYPFVLAGLSVLGTLTPLPQGLAERLNLPRGTVPRDAGEDWQGWPRLAFGRWRQHGALRFFQHTLWPSHWWQRLYYGVAIDRPLLWTRTIRHPLHVLRMALRRGKRRI